jgi:6,7-dimethyl-8-ribityllumazine synthase
MSDAPRLLILESRYYAEVAANLLAGATGVLDRAGARYDTIMVPGALEIPGVLSIAVAAGVEHPENRYDGYILLGCVIRGETSHYDVVVGESARGVMDLVVGHGLAVGFGILTVENREQALVRSRVDKLDKGGGAAAAALAVIEARRQLESRT